MYLLEILKLENFENWLNEQDSIRIVGYSRQNNSCPIATFLKEKGFEEVDVAPTQIQCSHYETNKTYLLELRDQQDNEIHYMFDGVDLLPGWIFEFIMIVDNRWANEIEAYSAKQALQTVKAYL